MPIRWFDFSVLFCFIKAMVLSLFSLALFAVSCQASEVRIHEVEQRTNYFSGQTWAATYRLTSERIFQGTLAWHMRYGNRTIQRGQREIRIKGEKTDVGFETKLPDVKEGIVMPIDLDIWAYKTSQEIPTAHITKRIWIFSKDPFGQRVEELRRQRIHLFDPRGQTTKVLTEIGIPYTPVYRVEAIKELRNTTLIIGEGTSLKRYRGLAQLMLEAGSVGNRVVSLNLKQGVFKSLPFHITSLLSASSFRCSGNDFIAFIDKRIDASTWSSSGKVPMCGIRLAGRGDEIMGEIECNGQGWSWLEVEYRSTAGKFIFCGLSIVNEWESGPAPRYLLNGILQYLEKKE